MAAEGTLAEEQEETRNDLVRRIENYLFQRNPTMHSSVRIAVEGDDVVLSGIVASYHHRQLCIHTCQRVAGVIRIVDRLKVAAMAGLRVRSDP